MNCLKDDLYNTNNVITFDENMDCFQTVIEKLFNLHVKTGSYDTEKEKEKNV